MPYRATTAELNRLLDRAHALTSSSDRYIDCSVILYVVEQDLDYGGEVIKGKPLVVSVQDEPLRAGGIWDTLTSQFVDFSDEPVLWYAGPMQAEIITRDIRKGGPSRLLMVAAESGGKTYTAAQATVWRQLKLAERGEYGDWGVTAPVSKRLGHIREAIMQVCPIETSNKRFPGAWGYIDGDDDINFVFGRRLQLRATKPHSKDVGSPIQGYTWQGSTDDELQDSIDLGADPNIESRLRGARYSERICTCTIKDSSKFRDDLNVKKASALWDVKFLDYRQAHFIWPEHWQRMKASVSDREYRRRVLCEEVPPENQLFYTFSREQNVKSIPDRWIDCTREVLQGPHDVLLGYDPGSAQHYTAFLKAFCDRKNPNDYKWWVVKELLVKQVVPEEYASMVHRILVEEFRSDIPGRNSGQALIHSDKWISTRLDHDNPDRTVYTAFKNQGLRIRPAVYNTPKPRRGGIAAPVTPGDMPFYASCDMVCGLLRSADGQTHLFIDTDDLGYPVAPHLVKSLEQSERDLSGKAHIKPKDKRYDLSDPHSGVRLALWPIERIRFSV